MGERRGSRRAGCPVLAVVALSLLAACAVPPAEVEPPTVTGVDVAAVPALPDRVPSGTVRVAYPEDPADLLDDAGDDPAAADLAAIWGLPLFRVDPAGQLAPGAVERWQVADDAASGWAVDVTLREGEWSDGRPVTSEDVVATLQVVRTGPGAAELSPLTGVEAADDRTVRLRFDRPYARWWALLDGVGILPAHVLREGGTGAFATTVPVSGGWFTVAEHVPGLRTRFSAHVAGPLGAPGLEAVEVLVVPRYETALGMLQDGEVDAVVGYLALNGVERARRAAEVEAAAPVGGTIVSLRWRADGPLGGPGAADRRRAIGDAIDVSQLVEGLLGPAGEMATSPVPGIRGAPRGLVPASGAEIGEPVVALPRWQETLAFTARAVQRDLRTAGGGLALRAEPAAELVDVARREADGALVAVRTGPRPSLVPAVADPELGVAADAAGPGTAAFADGLEEVERAALVWPLYRVGVLHAWSPAIRGLRPSAWSGLAFWDVGAWTVERP